MKDHYDSNQPEADRDFGKTPNLKPETLAASHSTLDSRPLTLVTYSNAKMRFQSFFMLMMVQLFFFASSYSAWVNVPTLVLGSPCAGP